MDLVRLAIVYDTSQAAGALNHLNGQLATVNSRTELSAGAMRKGGQAALVLAQGLSTGSISAAAMSGSLGRVATILFGPWGIAIGVAVGLLTLFKNNADKARAAQVKFGDELRDVRRRVDDLLSARDKSPFEAEVERLTDRIADLDRAIKAANSSWGTFLQGALAIAAALVPGLNLNIPLPGAPPEAAQRGALTGQRDRIDPLGDTIRSQQRAFNRPQEILDLIGGSGLATRAAQLQAMIKALEQLLTEFPDAKDSIEGTAAGIRTFEKSLQEAQRAAALMERGLFTITDAIEDFVIAGTFAFTEFLNNILRLLYRDFTGELVSGIVSSAFSRGGGTVTTGDAPIISGPGAGPSPSVASNVTFNINAIDAQGVAAFIQGNGAQIAATVAGHAARARGLRKQLTRG